jgi:hypothetical protein
MFTPAQEPKTHFPPLPCRPWPLDVALRDLPSNTGPAALPARTKPESPTSWPCLSSQLLNRAVLSGPCTLRCAPSTLCSGLLT